MANSAAAWAYEIFELSKNGNVVDITGTNPYGARVTTFDYYESLLSPNITAIISFADIGGSAPQKYDRQGKLGTLSSALPLDGDVEFFFRIVERTGFGELDFTKKPLVFNKKITPDQNSFKEGVILSLVSKYASVNQDTNIYKTFRGNIGNSVRKILTENLKVPADKIIIDPTSNALEFSGESRDAFQLIIEEVANRSIPENGNPGYFFYETQDGFNFRSIDDLIVQDPVAEYFKTDVLRSGVENDENNFKISLKSDIKAGDIITGKKCGVYATKRISFDPKTQKYDEEIYTLSNDKLIKSLGKNIEIPDVDFSTYTRTLYSTIDLGSYSANVKSEVNNDPKRWQAQSISRYNMLFNQIVQIQVPCNTNLRAGDTIICRFETITQDKKDPTGGNPDKYLILNLCHHFDSLRSFTSMTIVRDSYGSYTNKNKR
jgi:hypothetical protein